MAVRIWTTALGQKGLRATTTRIGQLATILSICKTFIIVYSTEEAKKTHLHTQTHTPTQTYWSQKRKDSQTSQSILYKNSKKLVITLKDCP